MKPMGNDTRQTRLGDVEQGDWYILRHKGPAVRVISDRPTYFRKRKARVTYARVLVESEEGEPMVYQAPADSLVWVLV